MLHNLIANWDKNFGYNRQDYVKQLLKFMSSFLSQELLNRARSYSILRNSFFQLLNVDTRSSREQVWDRLLDSRVEDKLTVIEFGVYKGDSIKYFAKKNRNQDSVFIGFDSFMGLPEAWAGNPVGYFSALGESPNVLDSRISFIKGYFNESWNKDNLKDLDFSNLIVHFDADLYSSTLFALAKIDELKVPYYAIFDEFMSDEIRALHDYKISFGATIEFLCKQDWRGYPEVVLASIRPKCS